MKKILIVVSIFLLSITLNAREYTGKIDTLKIEADGTIKIKLPGIERPLSGTAEQIKQMYALALSAKMADLTVTLNRNYTTSSWDAITLP